MRAAALQLTGALMSARVDDAWADGRLTAAQRARVAELQKASQARVPEANDNRHLSTASEWWSDLRLPRRHGMHAFDRPVDAGRSLLQRGDHADVCRVHAQGRNPAGGERRGQAVAGRHHWSVRVGHSHVPVARGGTGGGSGGERGAAAADAQDDVLGGQPSRHAQAQPCLPGHALSAACGGGVQPSLGATSRRVGGRAPRAQRTAARRGDS
eukprot:101624-Pleurochrysis_carterae.AAC.6